MPDAITLREEDFLRKEFQDAALEELSLPMLVWEDLMPHVPANAPRITYLAERLSHMTDPLKLVPPVRAGRGEFASVRISGLERDTAAIRGWGLQLVFDPEMIMWQDQIDDVQRARQRFSWWLAEWLNNSVASDITNNFSTTFTQDAYLDGIITRNDTSNGVGYEDTLGHLVVDVDATGGTGEGWESGNADRNPVGDIFQWKTAFESQEPAAGELYPYNLTDLFLDTVNYGQLVEYMIDKTSTVWQVDPQGGAVIIPSLGGVRLTPNKAAFYDLNGAKKVNTAFLFDRGAMPATIYEGFDARFGRVGPWNTNQYEDPKDHTTIYQAWAYRVTVLKRPKAFGMVFDLSTIAGP